MSYKSILFTYAIIAIALLSMQCITANLNDNEVNDIPETYSTYTNNKNKNKKHLQTRA